MENKQKITYSLILCFLLISCNVKKEISSKCKNHPEKFKSTKNKLIFIDKEENLYIRFQNNIPKKWNLPLSECKKLPYIFIDDIALINNSISKLKNEINIKSFKKIKGTKHYYKDKSRTFTYRENPVCWPPFYEIKINSNKIIVIDSITISNKKKTYKNGMEI